MKKLFILLLFLGFVVSPTIIFATNTPEQINQKVCDRFEQDLSKLAAIMEELRRREGVTETRVAFGGIDNAIKSADYSITYAAEAVAYQRAQKYSSNTQLKYSLVGLQSKVLKAKTDVGRAIK